MSDHKFKLQINFTKSYVAADGGHYLEGIASGPEVDLTGERMSPEALKSMVGSIHNRLIEFRDAHKDEWNDDLGEVVDLSLDDNNHLIYRTRLDMNLSGAKDLWYRMHTLGKKYGVSIGGSVLKAGMEYVAELGRQVYTYFDVELFEISITRQAAYQYSFANAVLKSLPKGHPMSDTTQKPEKTEEVVDEVQVTQDATEDKNAEVVAAEEQSDATPQDAPAEEVEVDTTTEEEAAADADATTPEEVETETEVEEETEEEVEAPVVDAPESVESEDGPEVTKALTEAQTEVATLTKSLTDTQAEVEELTKSLSAKTDEAEAALTELVEVKKSLAEKEAELEKRDARKAIVFDKFHTSESQTQDQADLQKAAQVKFAGFIANGTR